MSKLYQPLALEKARTKAEPMFRIGGLKRTKKEDNNKEMAVAE